MPLVPIAIEKSSKSERSYDIFSRLLKERIVFVTGEIESTMASIIVAQLIFLEADNPEKDIHMYIDSPGGSVVAGLSIYDTIQFIQPDVTTLCVGQACSMGAFLLASGAPGKRFSMPNSTIMIHQLSGGFRGQGTDIQIQAKETNRLKKLMNTILSNHTHQTIKQVEKDTERDNFMTAEDAVKYGLIDKTLYKREKQEK